MNDREDLGLRRRDRFSALDLARRAALGEVAVGPVGTAQGVGFASLVETFAQAPEPDRPARPPASGADGPTRIAKTDTGDGSAEAIAFDTITLFPQGAVSRAVKVPRGRTERNEDGPSDADLSIGQVRRVLAVAPDQYDPADVAGSETTVILVPLARWRRHPALSRQGRDPRKVLRAWEAFSLDGEPFGLVLWQGDQFAGVDLSGYLIEERTLAGAAWQISANR